MHRKIWQDLHNMQGYMNAQTSENARDVSESKVDWHRPDFIGERITLQVLQVNVN